MTIQIEPMKARSGAVKVRMQGWRAWLTHRTFRRGTQLLFALFILLVTVQHVIAGEGSENVTASPEAFCPFGGLETLYKYIGTGGSLVSHTHLSNLVILVAVLLTALLARSAFCGWICPLGFIQDLTHNLSQWIQKHVPAFKHFVIVVRQKGGKLSFLDRYFRFFKYGVLAWAVTGAAVYGIMVFRDYDPWSALINIAEFSFTPGLAVLCATLVLSFFVERPWCRYACPLGAASGLIGKLSPVYLKREKNACKVCNLCTRACPMGIDVARASTVRSADCIACLECVGACPRNGALDVKVGWPLMGE